jgi:hypothetical protein
LLRLAAVMIAPPRFLIYYGVLTQQNRQIYNKMESIIDKRGQR